jgi:tRNA (guanine-N7-)-methyltransferase
MKRFFDDLKKEEMRQRKVKDLEEKLLFHEAYMVTEPSLYRERWKEFFSGVDSISLEIGCGKGRFITSLGQEKPDCGFVGVEGHQTVALRAMEKIGQMGLSNVAVVPQYVRDVRDWFGQGELAAIYLNFSDPWPKDRHEKRRLTSAGFLEGYRHVLEKDGFLQMKTDNDGLFQYSLDSLAQNGFEIVESSWDYHGSSLDQNRMRTEYEEKFANRGLQIHYVKAKWKVLV